MSVAISSAVALAVILAGLVYFVNIYNNLVVLRENVKKTWSNIDVLLKQRHDELPKLVEVCKQYMGYEQETLERVMRARAAVSEARANGNIGGVGAAEGQLRLGLGNLFAVAEQYPELKANQTFQHLQARITTLEETIADRREFYNETVNTNNIRIDQFPDIVVARLMSFNASDLLEFADKETQDVSIKSLFA